MSQISPLDRDRAQRRVRVVTTATAAGGAVLALLGAVVAAGTFAGRTVASTQPSSAQPAGAAQAVPTQDPNALQQPLQTPGDGSGVANGGGSSQGGTPVTSGSS